MSSRRPQINFQVEPALKLLYEEARAQGHWVPRLCAAGLLLMVENPTLRAAAIDRLRDWENEFASASEEQIRDFVRGAEHAMRNVAQGSPLVRKAPPHRKRAKRGESV